MKGTRGRAVRVVMSMLMGGTLVGVLEAAEPPRNLSSYAIMGMQSVRLNAQFQLVTPMCHIGVNCPGGVLNAGQQLFTADGDQLVGDVTNLSCPADIFGVFANSGSATPAPGPGCTVRGPVKSAQAFAPPILAPNSCPNGVPNPDALAAACGFPSPFPACGANAVVVQPGKDCAPYDPIANNSCDLPPGVYGAVTIKDGAAIALTGGTYTVCSFVANKQTSVTATLPAIVRVTGELQFSNQSKVGVRCGDLTFQVNGTTDVQFGKSADIIADVCAPRATLRLGHSNYLKGHFFGDGAAMDRNNLVECCPVDLACTCFDRFIPTSAAVGATVHLTGSCDLSVAQGVVFDCGGVSYPAVIQSISSGAIDVAVPAIPVGATCKLAVRSPAGWFVHDQDFTVLP